MGPGVDRRGCVALGVKAHQRSTGEDMSRSLAGADEAGGVGRWRDDRSRRPGWSMERHVVGCLLEVAVQVLCRVSRCWCCSCNWRARHCSECLLVVRTQWNNAAISSFTCLFTRAPPGPIVIQATVIDQTQIGLLPGQSPQLTTD